MHRFFLFFIVSKFQSFKIKPLRNNFCPLSYIYYFFKELKLSFPALIMRTHKNILNIRLEARSEFEGSVNFEMKKQHSNNLNIRLEARSEFEGSVNFEIKKQHSNK